LQERIRGKTRKFVVGELLFFDLRRPLHCGAFRIKLLQGNAGKKVWALWAWSAFTLPFSPRLKARFSECKKKQAFKKQNLDNFSLILGDNVGSTAETAICSHGPDAYGWL
jgi:hypothetical protein